MIAPKPMTIALAALASLVVVLLGGARRDEARRADGDDPGDRLTRATRIRLDFHDRPIAEVVRAIGAQSGKRISDRGGMIKGFAGQPGDRDPDWRLRPVTLDSAEPVPFWEAIDRLGEAGRVGFHLGEYGDSGSAMFGLSIDETGGGAGGLVQYAGPFRVELTALHEHCDAMFVRGPWVQVHPSGVPSPINAADLGSAPTDGGPLYAELRVMIEPGLICRRDGPLKDLDATDAQGRSMLAPSAEERLGRSNPYADFARATSPPLRIPLRRPDDRVGTIDRLRGSIPVEIAAVQAEPALVIPLKGSQGKQFRGAGAVFTVETLAIDPNTGRVTLVVTGRLDGDVQPPGVREARLWSLRTYQFRVVDAEGKTCRFSSGGNGGNGQGSISVRFEYEPILGLRLGSGPPAEFRVFDLDRASWAIPFEFRDVPLP